MSDERCRVVVGVLPSGGETFVAGSVNPVAIMLREVGAALDREREIEARALAAKAADVMRATEIERAKNTRRARVLRKLSRALRMFRRMK
jgi:hypothetical protein